LQRQNYYAEFAEGFKPSRELPIPEETVNTWIDALTIKTFNEELKSVFPFIYRLVDQPESIGYEDLVGEGKVCDVCEKDPCKCDEDLEEHDHLEDFERHLDDISTFEYDIPQQQQQPQQAANAREVVEFIMSMYDQEQGTFPKGEEGVKIAVEKRFGDHAGQFASQVVERLSAKEQAQQPDYESMQGAIQEAADAATVGELEAAIKKFQTAAGITADGKMGPVTQKAMQAAKHNNQEKAQQHQHQRKEVHQRQHQRQLQRQHLQHHQQQHQRQHQRQRLLLQMNMLLRRLEHTRPHNNSMIIQRHNRHLLRQRLLLRVIKEQRQALLQHKAVNPHRHLAHNLLQHKDKIPQQQNLKPH
jgi:hypothetical protein